MSAATSALSNAPLWSASPAEAATAEMARAGADDRRTHKIALVRRLAAATIEDAGSAR